MTSTRFIALLRGINVGGHRVKMDRLREIFAGVGLRDVSTFIASGNVAFTAHAEEAGLTPRIEAALEDALGYEVATFLRTLEELRAVADHQPQGHTQDRSLYVAFLDQAPDAALRERLAAVESPSDRFSFGAREVYWSIDGKLSESPLFGAGIERALAVRSTTRNATTLRRLAQREAGAP